MLKIGLLTERLQTQGYVCIVDDYEEKAVRLEIVGGKEYAYIKRKGHKEVKTLKKLDGVQDIINDLNNRELTRKEYDNY